MEQHKETVENDQNVCACNAQTSHDEGAISRKSGEKREAILCAARDCFLAHGLKSVTMDQIASQAQVSKRTVYSHFGSKEELFLDVMKGKCLIPQIVLPQDDDAPVRDVLIEIGINFMKGVFEKDKLCLFTSILQETQTHPELGVRFYEAGPAVFLNTLAEYLQRQKDCNRLNIDDPLFVSGMYLSSLKGTKYTEVVLGKAPIPQDDEIELIVTKTVDYLLNGVRVSHDS